MNNLIMTRITAAVKGHQSNPDMVGFCLPVCVRAWCMCVVVSAVFFEPDPRCEKKGKEFLFQTIAERRMGGGGWRETDTERDSKQEREK